MTGVRVNPHLKLVSQTVVERDGQCVTIERGLVEVRQRAFRKGGRAAGRSSRRRRKKSIRDVPFPASLYHHETLYREHVTGQKALMGRGWNELDLVFPSPKGTPINSNWLREGRFKVLLKRAGFATHFTLYSFLYTSPRFNCWRLSASKVIADLMGHAWADFTAQVYQKVLPEMRERASDRLAGLLFDGPDTIFTQPVNEHEM